MITNNKDMIITRMIRPMMIIVIKMMYQVYECV